MTDRPLLDACDPAGIERYLAAGGWLAAGERVLEVARAGEGNMNLTLRVATTARSVIVKQGRPWVERHPAIPAPGERTLVEARWYELAGEVPSLAERMPTVLGVDRQARVLLLGDLGDAPDCLHLYGGGRLAVGQLDALVDWLLDLHGEFSGDARAATLDNRAMRELNHEHIFEIPLSASGGPDLDEITPGLREVAAGMRRDRALLCAVRDLGRVYLGDGSTLLHGDYYPGSWLQAPRPWVIDPEFGFYGPPEFDLGVMLAHLGLAGQPPELAERALARYRSGAAIDPGLVRAFAGIEVIRRLLGVAQLRIAPDLDAKRRLLETGRAGVLGLR